MDHDDLLPRRKDDLLGQLCREDLDRLSVAELEERIATLEGEIGRVRSALGRAGSSRAAADALFRRP